MARQFGTYSPRVPINVTWEDAIQFLDEAAEAVDLTGFEVHCQLRTSELSPIVVLDLSDPTNGTVLIEVDPEDLIDLLPLTKKLKKYVWSIVLNRIVDKYRIPLVQGKVTFVRNAVRYNASGDLA